MLIDTIPLKFAYYLAELTFDNVLTSVSFASSVRFNVELSTITLAFFIAIN